MVAGSSGIHRRVVHFISPGRGRMGNQNRPGPSLRWIVLHEGLAARLAAAAPSDRGYANFYEKALFVKPTWRPPCGVNRPLSALRAMLLFALSGSPISLVARCIG